MLLSFVPRPEFAAVLRHRRSEQLEARRAIFERAIARGELPAGSDSDVLVELVLAPLIARLFYVGSAVDEHFIRSWWTPSSPARAGALRLAPSVSVSESDHGAEEGVEGLDACLVTKFVSEL